MKRPRSPEAWIAGNNTRSAMGPLGPPLPDYQYDDGQPARFKRMIEARGRASETQKKSVYAPTVSYASSEVEEETSTPPVHTLLPEPTAAGPTRPAAAVPTQPADAGPTQPTDTGPTPPPHAVLTFRVKSADVSADSTKSVPGDYRDEVKTSLL